MKKDRISGKGILLTLALWLGCSIVACGIAWGIFASLFPHIKPSDIPTLVYVDLFYLLLPITIIFRYGGFAGLRHRLALRYTGGRDLIIAVAAWGVFAALVLVIYFVGGSIFSSPQSVGLDFLHKASDMSRLPTANWLAWGLILVRVFLLAGLAEELFFRGLLYGWLRTRYSVSASVVTTSVLFAAEHFYPILLPLVFLLGLFAGYVRERTGSILNTLVMHILTDGTILVCAYMVTIHS